MTRTDVIEHPPIASAKLFIDLLYGIPYVGVRRVDTASASARDAFAAFRRLESSLLSESRFACGRLPLPRPTEHHGIHMRCDMLRTADT